MIKRIVQKTGISEDQARQAVSVVINYLKERLPAPIAAQVDDTLSVDKIRGITTELAVKLKERKISNTEQLLKVGWTPKADKGLAKLVEVDPKELLELLNRADLDRVGGIGAAYANLLEETGVDTVRELSKRVPANLHVKILEINQAKKITTHPPTLQQVETWVTEAKGLPVLLEY